MSKKIIALVAIAALMQINFTMNGQITNGAAEKSAKAIEVTRHTVAGNEYIVAEMDSDQCRVTMADSVLPDENDRSVLLCVAAAFTGEMLETFKASNVAGDYVIDGVARKGYECPTNTGLLFAPAEGVPTITTSENSKEWIARAQRERGAVFQQGLLVHNGEIVYINAPIKPERETVYRSACVMGDGTFAVIQSVGILALGDFIKGLVTLGARHAIYLDMGRWCYGWYRENTSAEITTFSDFKFPYQTNWLVIKAKQ